MCNLRKIRFEQRVTQIDLMVKTGIWPSRISLLENGYLQPKPDEKEKLARALGVKIEELFEGDGSVT